MKKSGLDLFVEKLFDKISNIFVLDKSTKKSTAILRIIIVSIIIYIVANKILLSISFLIIGSMMGGVDVGVLDIVISQLFNPFFIFPLLLVILFFIKNKNIFKKISTLGSVLIILHLAFVFALYYMDCFSIYCSFYAPLYPLHPLFIVLNLFGVAEPVFNWLINTNGVSTLSVVYYLITVCIYYIGKNIEKIYKK